MAAESLIAILEQIRDQQKQQLMNFERALKVQTAAADLNRRFGKLWLAAILIPWLLVAVLLFRLLFAPGLLP